jgi:hypothetical protein
MARRLSRAGGYEHQPQPPLIPRSSTSGYPSMVRLAQPRASLKVMGRIGGSGWRAAPGDGVVHVADCLTGGDKEHNDSAARPFGAPTPPRRSRRQVVVEVDAEQALA